MQGGETNGWDGKVRTDASEWETGVRFFGYSRAVAEFMIGSMAVLIPHEVRNWQLDSLPTETFSLWTTRSHHRSKKLPSCNCFTYAADRNSGLWALVAGKAQIALWRFCDMSTAVNRQAVHVHTYITC